MAKIYTPEEGYTGLIAGVSFIHGVGETKDNWLINWFKNKGYKVEKESEEDDDKTYDSNEVEENITAGKETLFNDMKVEELKAIAKEKEVEGYSKMNKEDLIAALAGE